MKLNITLHNDHTPPLSNYWEAFQGRDLMSLSTWVESSVLLSLKQHKTHQCLRVGPRTHENGTELCCVLKTLILGLKHQLSVQKAGSPLTPISSCLRGCESFSNSLFKLKRICLRTLPIQCLSDLLISVCHLPPNYVQRAFKLIISRQSFTSSLCNCVWLFLITAFWQ